ncbi:MAG: hypothetical protein OHK0039_43710 [Bacteroidia bacterium]
MKPPLHLAAAALPAWEALCARLPLQRGLLLVATATDRLRDACMHRLAELDEDTTYLMLDWGDEQVADLGAATAQRLAGADLPEGALGLHLVHAGRSLVGALLEAGPDWTLAAVPTGLPCILWVDLHLAARLQGLVAFDGVFVLDDERPEPADDPYAKAEELRAALVDLEAADRSVHLLAAGDLLLAAHRQGAEARFEEVLDREAEGELRARALCGLGIARNRSGNMAAGIASLQAAADCLAEDADPALVARVHRALGDSFLVLRDHEQAFVHYRKVLPAYRQSGQRAELADTLRNLGRLMERRGEAAKAMRVYEELADMGEELADEGHLAYAYQQMGALHQDQQQWEAARTAYEQALVYARRLEDAFACTAIEDSLDAIGEAQAAAQPRKGLFGKLFGK